MIRSCLNIITWCFKDLEYSPHLFTFLSSVTFKISSWESKYNILG